MTCTFIGHRDCSFSIKERLDSVILELINRGVTYFLVGNNGNFDGIVQTVLTDLLKRNFDIDVSIVLSYIYEKAISAHQELTVFPEELSCVPKRFAISKRNEYLLKKSSLVVCHINNTFSNSYKYGLKKRAKRDLQL